MHRILRSPKLSTKAKLRIHHGLVIPILTYGAESWPLTAALTQKLEYVHQCQLRKILGVKWQDLMSNAEVHLRLKTESMEDLCRQQRMLWLAHVVRMPEDRLPKILLFGQQTGPRRSGRIMNLRHLYSQDIMHLKGGYPDGLDWYELALDRNVWPKFVMRAALVQHPAAAIADATGPGLQLGHGPHLHTATEHGHPAALADAIPADAAPPPPRRSTRIIERMGQTLSTPLLDPLTTLSGQPRRTSSMPYTGRPRGRPKGPGQGDGVYVPTGRRRGRPLGKKNSRHGF